MGPIRLPGVNAHQSLKTVSRKHHASAGDISFHNTCNYFLFILSWSSFTSIFTVLIDFPGKTRDNLCLIQHPRTTRSRQSVEKFLLRYTTQYFKFERAQVNETGVNGQVEPSP